MPLIGVKMPLIDVSLPFRMGRAIAGGSSDPQTSLWPGIARHESRTEFLRQPRYPRLASITAPGSGGHFPVNPTGARQVGKTWPGDLPELPMWIRGPRISSFHEDSRASD